MSDCKELAQRLGVAPQMDALQAQGIDDSIFKDLLAFHLTCQEYIQGRYFDSEFEAEGKAIRERLEKLLVESVASRGEEGKETVLSAFSALSEYYAYWWLSLDIPPHPKVSRSIAEQVFRWAESLFRTTEFLEFKRIVVRLSRDFGFQVRQVEVLPLDGAKTFQTVRPFFKVQHRFNDFERALKVKGLIAEDTRKAVLRSAFRNEGMETSVVWTGTISELSYLVKGLVQVGAVQDPGQEIWRIALGCFEVARANGRSLGDLRRSLREAKVPGKSRKAGLDFVIGCLG